MPKAVIEQAVNKNFSPDKFLLYIPKYIYYFVLLID